jgi:hypothetical protein
VLPQASLRERPGPPRGREPEQRALQPEFRQALLQERVLPELQEQVPERRALQPELQQALLQERVLPGQRVPQPVWQQGRQRVLPQQPSSQAPSSQLP